MTYCRLASDPPAQAKRAAREAGRCFDVWYLTERLVGFVGREEDMMAMDPAGCYGLVGAWV